MNKELNIADVFMLRYHKTAEGNYQQTYTPEEFDQMQEWLDRALGEYTQSMEMENKLLRARNERLEALAKQEQDGNVCARCGGIVFDPVIKQEQGEPVAWMDIDEKGAASGLRYWSEPDNRHEVALYTTPQQRTWVGLSDEEIFETHKQVDSMQYLTFGKAIEAKLKERNT
jgi:hypothetical protein